MNVKEFRRYMHNFEEQVIINGIKNTTFNKELMVSAKRGRLDSTKFGQLIGTQFKYSTPSVVDYYGMIKKSSGFIDSLNFSDRIEVKAAKAIVVHFASIKDAHIAKLAPDLMVGFPSFKEYMIKVRGFNKV